MNITGFLSRCRGLSFTKLSTVARRRIGPFSSEVLDRTRSALVSPGAIVGVEVITSLLDAELLDDGTERERREERESGHDDRDAEEQCREQRGVGRERPGRRRNAVLAGERARDRQRRDDQDEPA